MIKAALYSDKLSTFIILWNKPGVTRLIPRRKICQSRGKRRNFLQRKYVIFSNNKGWISLPPVKRGEKSTIWDPFSQLYVWSLQERRYIFDPTVLNIGIISNENANRMWSSFSEIHKQNFMGCYNEMSSALAPLSWLCWSYKEFFGLTESIITNTNHKKL